MEQLTDLQKNSIEKISQRLETEGWKFVKAREYQNTYIFRSEDEKEYFHIGDPVKIKRVVDVQTTLFKKGYPVSPIVRTGNVGEYLYLVESSLGNETYSDIFVKGIDDKTFGSFCEIVKLYFEAQAKNQLPMPDNYDVRKEVLAENVTQENPDLDLDLINSALDKLQHRLQELPFTYSHGDFAARNIMDKGVIDFEFYSIAPIGLDVFNTCLAENFWMFKKSSGEFYAKFCFEQSLQDRLIKILNDVCRVYNLERLLDYQNDFILFKAFWSTAHERQQAIDSNNDTKWRFRRSVLMYCIEKYLHDENIDTFSFKDLKVV